MEQKNINNPLLQLLNRPAFLVKDGIILQANELAQQRFIHTGSPISEYLTQDLEAYNQFTDGCLFLSVSIMDLPCSAAVTKMEGYDLFLLDNLADNTRQALALAAQQLREPLNVIFSVAEELNNRKASSQINHGLNQMHRIICNMADISRYDARMMLQLAPTDVTSVFAESVEKARTLVKTAGIKLDYTALPQLVISMADREMLERAVYNLVSNAVKFSNKGDTISAKLERKGKMMHFTLQDNGEGIPPEIMDTIFFRYLREPGIEDSRHGLGLGLALVCSIAACHNGTVLITQPETGGTRITMTMAISPCADQELHAPVRLPISNYAGGHDLGLLELSEVLPYSAYKQ